MEDNELEILSGSPILTNWIIKYDTWGMPQFIQGVLVGDMSETKLNGSTVSIHDIEIMDIPGSFIQTSSGQKVNLLGVGRKIIFEPETIFGVKAIEDTN